jgi:hypothetical protein
VRRLSHLVISRSLLAYVDSHNGGAQPASPPLIHEITFVVVRIFQYSLNGTGSSEFAWNLARIESARRILVEIRAGPTTVGPKISLSANNFLVR